MSKFGERIRDAMLTVGMETAAQLATACAVPRQTAAHWLVMKVGNLSAAHLLALSNALGVRMRWLMTGRGTVPASPNDSDMERAASIIEGLTRPQCERWFAFGERLVG